MLIHSAPGFRVLTAAFMASTMLVAAPALAQDESSGEDAQDANAPRSSLNVIIVTARKKEESLQDAPVAVSAFSGEELETRAAIDISDATASVPNVTFESAGTTSGLSAAPAVFIRGLGQADFVINADPAVGTYVDGVYVGRSIGSLGDLLDLSRVEVLRGPQGTLFGRNTIGGAVNMISKAPSISGFEGKASFAAGSRGFLHGTLSLNVPLGDVAAFRISGFGRQRDGFVDALQYDDFQLGEENVWGVRGALRIFPTDTITVDIVGDYSQRREAPAAVVPLLLGNVSVNGDQINASGTPTASRFNSGGPPATPPVPTAWRSTNPTVCSTAVGRNTNTACYGNVWLGNGFQSNARFTDRNGNFIEAENALDVYGLSGTVTIETPIGELKSITAIRGFEAEFYNDFDFSPYIIFHNLNLPYNQDQFSQELQLTDSGVAGGLIDYVLGLYYFKEDGIQTIDLVAPLQPPAASQTTLPLFQSLDREAENKSKAAYAQVTFHPTDSVHLTGGIRYTDEKKEVSFTQTRSVPNTPEMASGEQSISEVDVMGNISVDIADGLMAYATYSTGFRSGGFASRFPNGLVTPLPSFDPEFVKSYEFGFKSTLFNDKVRINFAAFLTDYTNLQVTAVSPDPELAGAAETENLADATLKGIELEVDAAVTDNLRVDFSIGLLDDKIDSLVGGSLSAGAGNQVLVITTDNDLPYTPAASINAGFTHFLPLDFGEFRTRVDWYYTSKQQLRIENHPLTEQEGYHRINANITFTPDNSDLDFTFGVRNLTNKNYSTAAAIASDASSISANVARPREFYGRVSFRF